MQVLHRFFSLFSQAFVPLPGTARQGRCCVLRGELLNTLLGVELVIERGATDLLKIGVKGKFH